MNKFKQLQEYLKSKIGKELKVMHGEAVKLIKLNNVKLKESTVKDYINLYFQYEYYVIEVVLTYKKDSNDFLVYINNDYGCLLEGVFNFNELDKFSTELNRALFEFTTNIDQKIDLNDLDFVWK